MFGRVHLRLRTESKPFPASFVQTQSSNEAIFECAVFKTPVAEVFCRVIYIYYAMVQYIYIYNMYI